ncbi:MAG TPA: TolC family protein [Myxococcales bacterium]|nr:TolC family protein [Myxococcales bacterium]
MTGLAALAAAVRIVTLDQAVQSARERQPQLREARASTEAASARASQALAPMLPQVSANASYLRTTVNSISRPGAPVTPGQGSSSFRTLPSLSDNVSASLLLFDFGATPNRFRAARAFSESARDSERSTALQVDFNVRAAYFDARANKALARVAEDTLANQQRHLEQTEGFVQAGTHPEIDLVQARTDTANARVQLINAQNAYEQSKVTLNAAMGVIGPTDYEVGDEPMPQLQDEDDPDGSRLYAEATAARPDVAALVEQVRANQLTASALRGQYGPAISATAGFTQAGEFLDRLGWNATAGVTLNWQIFQGGLTRAEVREAEAQVATSVAQLDLLRQQIRGDVDSARLAVRAAKASISATQEALANAKVRLQLAEQRYQVGVGSAIELGDAQVALTQAAAQAVQADDRLATARAQLLRALGRP